VTKFVQQHRNEYHRDPFGDQREVARTAKPEKDCDRKERDFDFDRNAKDLHVG